MAKKRPKFLRKKKKGGLSSEEQRKRTLEALKKKKSFKSFMFRGIALKNLLDLGNEELAGLLTSTKRRRYKRGLRQRNMTFLKRLAKAKKEAQFGEKPAAVKTHLRMTIITPEMIGSVIGVHNGKEFNSVEIKADMIGHYLGEFAITYHPVQHGRPGVGATHSSRFIPLK